MLGANRISMDRSLSGGWWWWDAASLSSAVRECVMAAFERAGWDVFYSDGAIVLVEKK